MTEPQLWFTFWVTVIGSLFIISAIVAGYFLGRSHHERDSPRPITDEEYQQFITEEAARHVS